MMKTRKINAFLRQLKMECRKALINKYFLITLAVSCMFCILSAWYQITAYYEMLDHPFSGNPMIQMNSLYNSWIGGEGTSLGCICFFYLMPLLAAFPYGWSYAAERKSGYVKQLAVRGGRMEYYVSKYIAVFLAGGLVILIPMVMNFLAVAMFIPAVMPDMHFEMYYAVAYGTMWSEYFYTAPLLYDIFYILLNFIFSGLFAVISLACSMVVRSRIAIVLLPYFIILLLHYSRTFLYYKVYLEISPLHFLQAKCVENNTCWWIVLLEAGVFFLVSLGMVLGVGKKRELV